jgi:hypothetical protein
MTSDELAYLMEWSPKIQGTRIIRTINGEVYRGTITAFFPQPPKNINRLQKKGVFLVFNIKKIEILLDWKEGYVGRKLIKIDLDDIKKISKR